MPCKKTSHATHIRKRSPAPQSALDPRGQVLPDLKASDFQVFEQIRGKKIQREQKVSRFEFVSQDSVKNTPQQVPKFPAGVYTNLVAARHLPVPPTVLLIDGLNT